MEASGITMPKKARKVRSNVKVMLTCFFDFRGLMHHEYAPEDQKINKEYHQQVLRRLREAVRRKRPDMWAIKNFQLHHDNAPAHSAHVIQAFLAKNSMSLVRQAPYSPDLAQCDFWLFPKLKTILKGRRFQTREDSMKKLTQELGSFPEEEFKRCFEKWQTRWEKCCMYRQGEYFEGERIKLAKFDVLCVLYKKVRYFLNRRRINRA